MKHTSGDAGKIKGIIFDLYGTLISVEKQRPYKKLFSELGLHECEKTQSMILVLTQNFHTMKEVLDSIKPEANLDLNYLERLIKEEVDSAKLFPETMDVLHKLKMGGYKLGLISNLASPYKYPFYKLQLWHYFDAVCFSCNEGLKKPGISIYKSMLDKLEISPEQAIMIGDHPVNDYKAALSAGMGAILLDRNNLHVADKKVTNLNQIFNYL
jgi:HAD superfamily hydrolase (TIGR01549 family)